MSAETRIEEFCNRAQHFFVSFKWKWGRTYTSGPDTVPQLADLLATSHMLYGSCLRLLREDADLKQARCATGRIVITVFRGSENHPDISLSITG
jgi:hypothetical protein